MLLSLPRLSFAQDSWRYPAVPANETRYIATNYNGGTGANPIATVAVSYLNASGFLVKYVRQDGTIAFQYNYNASDCYQMIPTAITFKKGATVADDRYAIVGTAATCPPGGGDPYNMWLVELDGSGNVTMNKAYDFKINFMPGSAVVGYYAAEPYSQNHTVPMDIKPVYFDNETGAGGYIVAGFITEDISNPVPFDAEQPMMVHQTRRQACFLRIKEDGNIIWGRTIETGAVPNDNHNWTMANKIVEIPGEGFAFTGQAIQRFYTAFPATSPFGVPGGILSGGFGYVPPSIVGTVAKAHITIVDEMGSTENGIFMASGNDLLYDPSINKVHLLASGLQVQAGVCSLAKGKPYLIVGTIDPMMDYNIDLPSMRLLDFNSIPSTSATLDRPAVVGSRVFFDPDNEATLIETGYFHNSVFTANGGITGSYPFFLRYHYPSQTVVGSVAQVFPHLSTNYYGNYPISRTFSPLNYFMNLAGVIDDQTLNGRQLQGFAPFFTALLPGNYLSNNVIRIYAPYNTCFTFSTGVATVPGVCPPFLTLPDGGTAVPGYKIIYTASTSYSLLSPTIARTEMPTTSNSCATAPFRPAGVEQQALHQENEYPAVYPVPADGFIYLRSKANSYYSIENAAGQVLKTGTIASEEEKMDIKELPSGLYIIRLKDARGESSFIKFTKK